MATTEVVAVEVVRALCGSVGLIAAVPLTTLLAVGLALEEPAAGPGAPAPAATGRAPYSPARGMDPGDATALFGRVLDLHGLALSSAVVGVVPGDSVEPGALPDSARQAGAQRPRPSAATGGRPAAGVASGRAWPGSTRPIPVSSSCSVASGCSRARPGSGSRATPTR